MEIYRPTIDEWEKLKKIRLKAIESEQQAFPGKLQKERHLTEETWQDWIEQRKGNALIFAKQDDNIIGMVGFKDAQGIAHIWGFYVAREYRGSGNGKKLFRAILKEIEQHGYQEAEMTVQVDQLRAISLYEFFGFSIAEKVTVENVEKYVMRKIKI